MNLKIGYFLMISILSCEKSNNINELKNRVSTTSKNPIKNSDEFKFSVSILEKDSDNRPSKLKIEITKDSNHIQDIIYKPNTWVAIKDSLEITQIDYYNKNLKIQEGIEDYHDFIIADFNFDNLEDFAILYDYGGNGGPSYSYFFQNDQGQFIVNKQFPLNEGNFPKTLDKVNKTITLRIPSGCCKIKTTIFKLKKDNNWEILSSKEENMN